MTTETKRKMLLLHDYRNPSSEIRIDPDAITFVQRLPMLPVDSLVNRTEEVPARTKVFILAGPKAREGAVATSSLDNQSQTLLVSELPGEIGFHAGWALAIHD